MKTEKIILAKDELETAKLKLIKAWLKRYFKGKKKMDSLELQFQFSQFLDNFFSTEGMKVFEQWQIYNFVRPIEDSDDKFELNPDIDNVRLLTRGAGPKTGPHSKCEETDWVRYLENFAAGCGIVGIEEFES